MQPTQQGIANPRPQSWQSSADEAWQVRRSLSVIRERLRVARLRAADRQRLADNASAAGQEVFEVSLREAADAHATTAHALEGTLVHLERRWSRIEDQRRSRERTAMQQRATSFDGVEYNWREAD